MGQNALIQSNFFKRAIIIMGEKVSDMDVELEQKVNGMQFLEGNIGSPDSIVIGKMKRLDFNKKIKQRKN